VAALNNVELITALLSCNRQLALVGLQLRIINGVVSLLTTEVNNKALADRGGGACSPCEKPGMPRWELGLDGP
jgi:hypothetical protein